MYQDLDWNKLGNVIVSNITTSNYSLHMTNTVMKCPYKIIEYTKLIITS